MARGEAGPESDIDLLVEFEPKAGVGLLEFIRLQRELVELLGRRVDLVPIGGGEAGGIVLAWGRASRAAGPHPNAASAGRGGFSGQKAMLVPVGRGAAGI